MRQKRRHNGLGCRHAWYGRACAAGRALACFFMAFVLVLGPVPLIVFAQFDPAFAEEGEGESGGEGEGEGEQEAMDIAAADEVESIIASLPSPSQITVDDRPAIDAAADAYNSLTPSQQALVRNLDVLNAAIDAVIAAEEEQARLEEEERQRLEEEERLRQEEAERLRQEEEERQRLEEEERRRQEEERQKQEQEQQQQGQESYYVKTLLLKWDKPDSSGVTHYVGDNKIVEKAYRQIKVNEYGETVQLNGWYLSNDDTGVTYQAADASTAIGSFELDWATSDAAIASVSPDGLVMPHGKNGTVVITATVGDAKVYQGSAPVATVTIVFDGQEGKYVKSVEILDEGGNNIGEAWGGVTVYTGQNEFHQLHARVTWYNVADGSETVQETGTGDSYDAKQVDTTITWNISSSSAFSINGDTGRLKTAQYSGNAYITCSAVGGLGGKPVVDTANVQLDTGDYEYNPADSLTLRVVWEERPDEVVKEKTYSYGDLLGMLPSRRVNATVANGSRFGVIMAEGFLFKDVVNLISVDDGDVLQYRFGTADGYDNPVSYSYLFESGPRYYFPNYDVGSRAEGEIVPPILAYKSAFEWNRAEANPNANLDDGTRFRLVFGCLSSGDANTSFQIYYIDTITIVLAGAPSAGGGGGGNTGNTGNTGNSGGANGGTGGGENGGGADGTGGTGHGKTGAGSGTTGKGGGNSAGKLDGTDGDGKELAGAEQSTGQGVNESGGETDVVGMTEDPAGADINSAKRWRVYQMMNKTNSDVPDWDDENPISPFAAPLTLGTFAIGAGATGVGFRRRLR